MAVSPYYNVGLNEYFTTIHNLHGVYKKTGDLTAINLNTEEEVELKFWTYVYVLEEPIGSLLIFDKMEIWLDI